MYAELPRLNTSSVSIWPTECVTLDAGPHSEESDTIVRSYRGHAEPDRKLR